MVSLKSLCLTVLILFPVNQIIAVTRTPLPLPADFGMRTNNVPFTMEETDEDKAGPLEDPWQRNHPVRLGLSGYLEPEVLEIFKEYTQPHRIAWLSSVYQRSFLYRNHIFTTLARHQVPPELFFIPFIESEFIITARSTSNAMGMWQFVDNSMAPWMQKNAYKDERLSFYQATEAGIAKLIDNYRVLGDWLLAAAAYNGGLGTVTRAMSRTGLKDFWSLARANELPQETQRYVPKLLATALFVEHWGRLSGRPQWFPPVEWTQTMVPGGVPLETLAKEAGIDPELIFHANRNLLLGVTPPNERFYPVTLPTNSAPRLASYLLSSGKSHLHSVPHVVRPGETLWSIALAYGIPWELIQSFNNLPNTGVRENQVLNIPLDTTDE